MRIVGSVFLMGFLLFIACARFKSYEMSASDPKYTVVYSRSQLDENKPSSFNVHETPLKGLTNPSAIYFFDDMDGWIGAGDRLFKTRDAAKTWNETKLPISDEVKVRQILFLNPSTGWVLLSKKIPDYVKDNRDHKSWLLYTNDGGSSWSTQYEGEFVALTQVSFSESQNGWLVGIKYIGSKGVTYTHFALRTNDQGQHWSDVSSGI